MLRCIGGVELDDSVVVSQSLQLVPAKSLLVVLFARIFSQEVIVVVIIAKVFILLRPPLCLALLSLLCEARCSRDCPACSAPFLAKDLDRRSLSLLPLEALLAKLARVDPHADHSPSCDL